MTFGRSSTKGASPISLLCPICRFEKGDVDTRSIGMESGTGAGIEIEVEVEVDVIRTALYVKSL